MVEIIRQLILGGVALGIIAGNSESIMQFYDDTTSMARQVATAGDLRTISLMLDYEFMKRGRLPKEDRFDRWLEKKIKRKILVNPKLQLGWAFFVAMLQLPGIVITGLAMSWLYLIYLDSNLAVSCNTSVLVVLAVICLILFAGVIVFIARRTTNIAGPVKKLRILMSEMAQGRAPENRITFRKGDWFSELEKDLNAMSQSITQANQARIHIRQTLERFKENLENGKEIRGEEYLQKTIDNLIKEL